MIRALASIWVCAALLATALRAFAEPAPAPVNRDDAVALLPLDAERSLEIYGQPIASELARALAAGSVAVVVVGPKMAMPERARLIVDGKIAVDRAGIVTIALRLRNTLDGTVLDTLSATAPGLAKIDAAANELSTRLVPLVRDRLAGIRRGVEQVRSRPAPTAGEAPLSAPRTVLFAAADASKARAGGRPPGAPLVPAFDGAIAAWLAAHHRQLEELGAAPLAAATVARRDAELAIRFDVLDYTTERASADPALPLGRARVHVQIADRRGVIFDRVVATDSVLGEHGLAPDALAARVAREVLAILLPHMRRSVPSW